MLVSVSSGVMARMVIHATTSKVRTAIKIIFSVLIVFLVIMFPCLVFAQGWAVYAWSGDPASLPAGYQLCNGENGTPDLRNRFLVGVGSYSLGDMGGVTTNTVQHRHVVDSHSHAISTQANHLHLTSQTTMPVMGDLMGNPVLTSFSLSAGGSHNHGGASGTASPYTNYEGSASLENRPPFYAVYYVCAVGLPDLAATEPYTFTVSSGQVVEVQRSMSYADLAIIGLLVCILMIVVIGLIFWAITRRS